MVDYTPLVKEMVHSKDVFFKAFGFEPSQFKPWMKPGDKHPPEFYDMVVANDIKQLNKLQDEAGMCGCGNVTWVPIAPVKDKNEKPLTANAPVCEWYCKHMGRMCVLHMQNEKRDVPRLQGVAGRLRAAISGSSDFLPLKPPFSSSSA